MRTKTTLSIVIIAVAVVGLIAVTANDRISAQTFGRGQFQTAGSCQSSCDQQHAFYGGSRNVRQGRGAGQGNWMRGSGDRLAASQGCSTSQECSDCDSGGQGCSVEDAGGSGNVSSCNSGRGRGRGWARGHGRSRGRNSDCGAGGGCCGG